MYNPLQTVLLHTNNVELCSTCLKSNWIMFYCYFFLSNFSPIRPVWPVAPERIWKWGAPVWRESGGGTAPKKNIFWSCPSTFLALIVQLVVLVSAEVMVSTVWSVYRLLFFYSRCPSRAQSFVEVGARAPPVHYGVGATACGRLC